MAHDPATRHMSAVIGEVISGNTPARQTPQEITMYKNPGLASQDRAAANAIWRMAEAENSVGKVDLLA